MRPEKYHLIANELYQTRRSELAEQLTRDEGDVPYVYQDSAGYWMIGIGFLIDKEKGGRLPEAVKNFWLDHEISEKHKLNASYLLSKQLQTLFNGALNRDYKNINNEY